MPPIGRSREVPPRRGPPGRSDIDWLCGASDLGDKLCSAFVLETFQHYIIRTFERSREVVIHAGKGSAVARAKAGFEPETEGQAA
jgi:hypothetical protein